MDDLTAILLLIAAGAAMGFVNNLAGGGGVIGLAAFDLVSGLPIAQANASLRVAAVTIAASGAAGFRSRQQSIPKRAWLYGLAAVPGAALGTWMAVELPVWVYELSLFVIVAFLLIRTLLDGRKGQREEKPTSMPVALLWFTLVGAHMGFVQIGVGLLIMAALSHIHSRDLLEVNAAKMAIVLLTSVTAVSIFAAAGQIVWAPAISLAAGAGLGSFAAGRMSVKRGHGFIRIVVIVVCTAVLVRSVLRLF